MRDVFGVRRNLLLMIFSALFLNACGWMKAELDLLSAQSVPFALELASGETVVTSTNVSLRILSLEQVPSHMAVTFGSTCDLTPNWEPFQADQALTLSTGDGVKYVSVQVRHETTVSPCVTTSITLDQTPPQSLSLNVLSGNPTATALVLVDGSGTDLTPPVSYSVSFAADCSGGVWTAIGIPTSHTLPNPIVAFDGNKDIYYKFKDGVGNESACLTTQVSLDTVDPVVTLSPVAGPLGSAVTSLALSGTCSENGTDNVSLSLASSGGGSVMAAADCSAGSWTETVNLAALANGTVTITARQLDAVGNEGTDQESFVRDLNAPTLTFDGTLSTSIANIASASALTVAGTCSEAGTSNVALEVNSDGGGSAVTANVDCASGAFSTSLDVSTLGDGSLTFAASQTDAAGNTGSATPVVILKDTVAPVLSSIQINAGATYTTSDAVTVSLSVSGSVSQYYATETVGCTSGGTWTNHAASFSFTLGASQGNHTVYVKERDAAGNETACVSASINYDNVAPSGVLSLNSGETTAKNGVMNVTLSSVSSDVNQMAVYEGACASPGTLSYVTFTAESNLLLADFTDTNQLEETRTVAAYLKDNAGNTACVQDNIILQNSRTFISFRSLAARISDATASLSIPVHLRNYAGTGARSISSSPLTVSYSLDDGGGSLTRGTVMIPAGSSSANIAVSVPDVASSRVMKLNILEADLPAPVLFSQIQFEISVVDSAATAEEIGVIAGSINLNTLHANDHYCVIKGAQAYDPSNSYGKLSCWGEGSEKQVDGNTGDQLSPVAVNAANDYVDVSAGARHTCGVTSSGALNCWGANDSGQLGQGSTNATPPAGLYAVTHPSALTWKSVTAGNAHTCAIDASNSLYCWGDNTYGQLGLGNTTASLSPSLVSAGWSQVAAGVNHNCAIKSDNFVYCWGLNSNRQADPTSASSAITTPTKVTLGGASDFKVATSARYWDREKRVGAGSAHSCALTSHLSADVSLSSNRSLLYCWGSNSDLQVGNPSASGVDVTTPYKTSTSTFYHVALGDKHTCVVSDEASLTARVLRCFGRGSEGQLGMGTTSSFELASSSSSGAGSSSLVDREVTVSGTANVNYVAVAAGVDNTCAVFSNSRPDSSQSSFAAFGVRCAGQNFGGVLGLGTDEFEMTPKTLENYTSGATPKMFSQVSVGYRSTCAIDSSQKLYCTGSGSQKLIGDGMTDSNRNAYGLYRFGLVPADSLSNYILVSVGANNACGITDGAKLKCWGENDDGRLGSGMDDLSAPVLVAPSQSFSMVSVGSDHICAIDTVGKLFCWGKNTYGQVGDGSTTLRIQPVAIDPTENYAKVSAGTNHTCAITTANKLKCWGRNNLGQLGIGSTSSATTPQAVDVANDYLAVSVDLEHSCAIRKSTATAGFLYCWGNNSDGRVGTGTLSASELSPVAVVDSGLSPLSDTFTAVNVGENHSCAIRSGDDKLLCWGNNTRGQIGDGTEVTRSYPVLTLVTAAAQVSAGGINTCAIESGDSTLKCWGYTRSGATGNRNRTLFWSTIPTL